MPIFEYKCRSCGREFEFLVRGQEVPVCPKCGSKELTKLLSMFNSNIRKGSGTTGSGCNTCTGGTCSTCGK
ncbi:MAG TPA: zinc ribbon domain-containing protein [Firmicutes bacterium]|jgi:putative FmdB family regulatory protein|nr:zinc ribbon domain-containing protein [Bacillota bacterium]